MKLNKLILIIALGAFSGIQAKFFIDFNSWAQRIGQNTDPFGAGTTPPTGITTKTQPPVIKRSELYKRVEGLLAPFGPGANAMHDTIASGGAIPPTPKMPTISLDAFAKKTKEVFTPFVSSANSMRDTLQEKAAIATSQIKTFFAAKKEVTQPADYKNVANYFSNTFSTRTATKVADKHFIKCDTLEKLEDKFCNKFIKFATNRRKQCDETQKLLPAFSAALEKSRDTQVQASRPFLDAGKAALQKISLSASAMTDKIDFNGWATRVGTELDPFGPGVHDTVASTEILPKFLTESTDKIKIFFNEKLQQMGIKIEPFNTMTPTETSVASSSPAVPIICTVVAGAVMYAAFKHYKRSQENTKFAI